ncbi:MAG: hypothetical protein KR126chlam2_00012 [Chlamydiae bacterium]|nr:hypothetical protein [Chlamydiota bacterium]
MAAEQRQIQLINLDQELATLWDKEQGQNRTRACLFNLVIYTQKAHRDQFYKELIKSVISKYPCRVIWITSDDTAKEPYLRSSVASETIGEGSQQIFCEIIHIEVAGKLSERVPYIILPQIVPDLPVYLLWTQDPATENAILPALEPFAYRIIFDSEASVDLQEFSHSVLSLINRFHCEVGDLNWTALSGWRKTVSSVFDTPKMLAYLSQSRLIQITYNKVGSNHFQHSEFEAAYMQGWLAAQLGWEFKKIEKSEGNLRLTYRTPTQEIAILLIPQEVSTLPPGAMLNLEIESAQDKAHFVFQRKPESRQIFVQYSDQNRCDLPFYASIPGMAEGQEIIEEIFYHHPGTHYRNTLGLLATIPWKEAL